MYHLKRLGNINSVHKVSLGQQVVIKTRNHIISRRCLATCFKTGTHDTQANRKLAPGDIYEKLSRREGKQ